jgi:hypothetical protein
LEKLSTTKRDLLPHHEFVVLLDLLENAINQRYNPPFSTMFEKLSVAFVVRGFGFLSAMRRRYFITTLSLTLLYFLS